MDKLLSKVQNLYGYSNYEIALIKYVIVSFFSEFSKLILIGFFYSWLGLLSYYIAAFFILLLLRFNGGGYHCKHYISCLVVTYLMSLFSIIILPSAFSIGKYIILVSLIICMLLNHIIGPIASPFRPTPDSLLLKSCKNNVFLIIFVFFIFVSIFYTNKYVQPYITVCFWITILNTAQLLVAKILQKGDK